eukprot:CAMPEP_0205804626 /NCGR_PEP_ID=MMETSP0205-20121125/7609_1 /ASSEMBLY_ACC=CAM_ASM_000278 /TAXON_ID=36767 /ORGANISM="Euplotes focardii, Strain TN1" /LENGTH=36 /DNA_ID= /DNA_START= /DNA_END= /DNA_ORIENTATION=
MESGPEDQAIQLADIFEQLKPDELASFVDDTNVSFS